MFLCKLSFYSNYLSTATSFGGQYLMKNSDVCLFLFLGHYISVDTSYEGEKAVLVSPDLYSEEWSCIRLIYQIATTVTSLDPARLNLYMRKEGESFDSLLWSAKEPSDSWLIASLDLTNSTKKYKVSTILEDNHHRLYCVHIVVDGLLLKHFHSWSPSSYSCSMECVVFSVLFLDRREVHSILLGC